MTSNLYKLPILKPAVLLTVLICLIYSNTLDSSWHFDDYHNITQNSRLHLQSLDWDAVKNTFFPSSINENLPRPLAYFTFALNWKWGQNNVTGYHIVNIAIHILTAFFLFLTILLLLQTPNADNADRNSVYFIALFSTVLWAVHPIQTQAVTYIVQRMASMAALFYVIGIFCFLKARMTLSRMRCALYWSLCGLAFLMGIASKNNAILLPVSLLLAEFIFFRDLSQKSTQKQAAAVLFCGVLVVAAFGIFLFLDGKFTIFGSYDKRSFSLSQRLLTQPAVVLLYLSQIIYPVPDRFSIAHDITFSTSLFTPWTTLPNIIIIFLLIALAFWRIKKNPVLSFALLFFFGNHAIESTILPLEMVFEHRNYLPSLFLFVPVAAAIKKALDYYRPIQKVMFYFLVVSLCVMISSLGMSSYLRNSDWQSEKTLWTDAMEKAPESGRPLHGLAWGYYRATGQYQKAIALFQKALDLRDDQRFFKADVYKNIALICFSDLKEYEKCVEFAKKAIEIYPTHQEANLLLCNALGMLGRYDESLKYLDSILAIAPENHEFLYLKGFILMKLREPELAMPYFRQCLNQSPGNWKYLREFGFCLTQLGNYDRGYRYLKYAEALHPEDPGNLIVIADNRIKIGRSEEAFLYINQFVDTIGVENIETVFNHISKNPLGVPVFFEGIAGLLSQTLRERSEKYSSMADRLTEQFVSN